MYTAHVHFFTNLDLFCIDKARYLSKNTVIFFKGYVYYRSADKSLERPGRKQANVSVRMA